ncbi:hypothetical protein [Actinomadura sp. SCN-SB]|uniref:hypothetical protein n=1 Tax=Actinomadura sp. SCN-SB TaxID=3373092 RepID=UPI0037505233
MDRPLRQLLAALDGLGVDLDVWGDENRVVVAYRDSELWWVEWGDADERFDRVVSEHGKTQRRPLGGLGEVAGIAKEIARSLGAIGDEGGCAR